jgi:LacI family transcriptional regulator
LFTAPDRPTAIFCGNVTDAEQVYLHAESCGLKVPRDLSLIAFGGTWRAHGLAERISSVVVDECALGARAAEVLNEMRSGRRALDSDERIEFAVTYLPGETIGPANRTAVAPAKGA